MNRRTFIATAASLATVGPSASTSTGFPVVNNWLMAPPKKVTLSFPIVGISRGWKNYKGRFTTKSLTELNNAIRKAAMEVTPPNV